MEIELNKYGNFLKGSHSKSLAQIFIVNGGKRIASVVSLLCLPCIKIIRSFIFFRGALGYEITHLHKGLRGLRQAR